MYPFTNRRIYDSDDENRKKSLHDHMNVRKDSNKDIGESSKSKAPQVQDKKDTDTSHKNACSNIVPTTEEIEAFDLVEVEHAPSSSPPLVQTNEEDDFDNFSTKPPEQILRRSSRVFDTSPPPTSKRRKKVVIHKKNFRIESA